MRICPVASTWEWWFHNSNFLFRGEFYLDHFAFINPATPLVLYLIIVNIHLSRDENEKPPVSLNPIALLTAYDMTRELPSPAAIRERAWAGDNTTSSFIPSTNVPCKN